jgi:polygalacturonase
MKTLLPAAAAAFSLLFALPPASRADADAAPAAAPAAKIFNVRELGAQGDGKADDTAAIQKALDACDGTGGTVQFPAGTYLSRPLNLRAKSTVLLEAGATLLASPVQAVYIKEGKGTNWLDIKTNSDFISFIDGSKLEDLTLTGQGTIDGNGAAWWDEAEKARQIKPGYTLPRPNLIGLEHCKNLHVSGLKLVNAPKFHLVPSDCEDLVIDRITILSPEHAANTDGIDPGNCRNVTISNCLIDTGDDNIAIKSGKKVKGREFGCENLTVTGCTFKHGHGMSIGSETVGGVHNLVVTNCTFEDTDNGLRIKSRRDKGGLVEDITYTDITMKNVHPAISIVAYYQDSTRAKYPKDDPGQPMAEKTPIFRNIRIANVTGNSTIEAGLIIGLPESVATNIVLENVHLSGASGLIVANAKGVLLKNSVIAAQNGPAVVVEKNAEVLGLPGAK